jgi:hypothetical protein
MRVFLRKRFLDTPPTIRIRADADLDKDGVRSAAGTVDVHLSAFDVVEGSRNWISGMLVSRCGNVPRCRRQKQDDCGGKDSSDNYSTTRHQELFSIASTVALVFRSRVREA